MDIVAAVEKYLYDTLQYSIRLQPLMKKTGIPVYLADAYTFYDITIGDHDYLLIESVVQDEPSPAILKKHCMAVGNITGKTCIYSSTTMHAYTRIRCIQMNIPFIVPQKQLFLPMLGLDLREQYAKKRQPRTLLTPAAQLVCCMLAAMDQEQMSMKACAEQCGYSTMTISRAFDEVQQVFPGNVIKQGRERIILRPSDRHQFIQTLKPVLINPVKKRYYGTKYPPEHAFVKAGMTAAAHYTDLAEPDEPVVAISTAAWKGLSERYQSLIIPVCEPGSVIIEVWQYSPEVCAQNGFVDRVSLWASLCDDSNERVQAARETLIGGNI